MRKVVAVPKYDLNQIMAAVPEVNEVIYYSAIRWRRVSGGQTQLTLTGSVSWIDKLDGKVDHLELDAFIKRAVIRYFKENNFKEKENK